MLQEDSRNIGPWDPTRFSTSPVDEAVWFDHFYNAVICPLFFAETLADLAKVPREGKSSQEEVAIIASKTPEWSGTPCYDTITFACGTCWVALLL